MFHEDEDCLRHRYDLVMAVSSLQYSEDWPTTLSRLGAAAGPHLFLSRVPTVFEHPSFLVRQRPYRTYEDTEYVSWVINREELLAAASLERAHADARVPQRRGGHRARCSRAVRDARLPLPGGRCPVTDFDLTGAYRGRRVLITGGLGFIGSNLARVLVDAGSEVLLVDSLIPEYGGNLANIDGIEDRVEINISDVRDGTALPTSCGAAT